MSGKRKVGRPPKPPGEKYETQSRQLGRVSDDEWERLKAAAESSGKSFTEWAVAILLRAAKRSSK